MTIKRFSKRWTHILFFALLIIASICATIFFLIPDNPAASQGGKKVKVAFPAYDTVYSDQEIVWLAEHADLIIMHESVVGKIPHLRAVNPDIIILRYVFSGITNETRIGHSASGFDRVYRDHQNWFLKDKKGNLVTDSYDAYSREHSFYMDPRNQEWQRYSAQDYLSGLGPWDGIFLDVVNLEIGEITPEGLESYPTDAGYQDAMLSYLAYAHSRFQEEGKLFFINGATFPYQDWDPWSRFLPAVDGIADESFAGRHHWGGGYQPEERWERQVSSMELAGALGKYFIAIAHDSGDDYRYNLGTYLLAENEKSYFYDMAAPKFRIQAFRDGFTEHDYAVDLGSPIGIRYPSQGAWLREFEEGMVVVNPGDKDITLGLDGYEDAEGRTSPFTVGPKDALFLYRFS